MCASLPGTAEDPPGLRHGSPVGVSLRTTFPFLTQEVFELVHQLLRVKGVLTPSTWRLVPRRVSGERRGRELADQVAQGARRGLPSIDPSPKRHHHRGHIGRGSPCNATSSMLILPVGKRDAAGSLAAVTHNPSATSHTPAWHDER
jgi:hypothetical protein